MSSNVENVKSGTQIMYRTTALKSEIRVTLCRKIHDHVLFNEVNEYSIYSFSYGADILCCSGKYYQ